MKSLRGEKLLLQLNRKLFLVLVVGLVFYFSIQLYMKVVRSLPGLKYVIRTDVMYTRPI